MEKHITTLTEQAFSPFLRRLLNAEAQAHGIPNDAIHVASSTSTPDGGEDGYIAWESDPDRTPFLPSRRNGFQLKAGKVTVAKAGREVLTKAGLVKNMRSVLEAAGHYHMLCAQPYVRAGIESRRERILATLHKAGLAVRDDQVLFRDADQIAEWANRHRAVAIWVKEPTQPSMIDPFRSWVHLAGRSEHELSPWAEDQRLPELSAHLQERIAEPHGVARVVGPSGIGKTRLVLEALGPTREDDCSLSDIVLYADASETDFAPINRVVQTWSDMGARAIVIVDRCASERHDVLARMVARSSSRLSLVTIDNEDPSGTLDKATFKLGEASASVIEAIVNGLSASLPSEDHRRLVHFGGGFPGIAIRTAVAWAESRPVAHATDDDFVRTFVLGRSQQEADLVFKSAKLLAAFRLVPVESDDLLSRIAALGREVSVADLRGSIQTLVDRGVVQRRGGSVVLQPGPIAMKLAERQWKEWTREEWDEVLAGDMNPVLRKQEARQLALLNNTDISLELVAHVCRARGSLDDPGKVFEAEDAEVLACLAEIAAATVANWIEEFLDKAEDLSDVGNNIRGRLVWAVEKIAFRPDTFEDGAQLLLRLAVAEGRQGIKGNATRKFIELFPMRAGNTGASGATRLSFLDGVVEADDPFQRLILVEAFGAKSFFQCAPARRWSGRRFR